MAAASLAVAGCAGLPDGPSVPIAPRIDYHQHLVSPAYAQIVKLEPLDADALLAGLDEAGVQQAIVLSTAYSMADDRRALPDPDRLVRQENDWTSDQVSGSKGRLIGFCGINPLRDEALREIERCLALPGMVGVKLHFGNSGVSMRDPANSARLIEIFSLAGRSKIPVLVHMRARGGANFGGPDAQLFIERLLPLTPDSDVIVAHFGGAGPGYPQQADDVIAVFAAAAERKDPRLRRTYFDVATILTKDTTPADGQLITKRIRQLGPRHVLYGSDLVVPGSDTIGERWRHMIEKLSLTPSELRTIANNRLPFLR